MKTFKTENWPKSLLSYDHIIENDATLINHLRNLSNEMFGTYPNVEVVRGIVPEFKPHVAVDLGANFGLFASTIGRHFSEVHAFEASTFLSEMATIFPRLEFMGANYGNNLKIYNLAAADKTGNVIELYQSINANPGDNSIYMDKEAPDALAERCFTISLPDIFKLIGHDYIDYMKLDIESAEYPFLMNQDLSQIGCIFMELHKCFSEDYTEKELLKHMSKYMNMYKFPHDPILWCFNKNYKIDKFPSWSIAGMPNAPVIPMHNYGSSGEWEIDPEYDTIRTIEVDSDGNEHNVYLLKKDLEVDNL